MSEGLQESWEENKFKVHCGLAQLESERGGRQCPERSNDGGWKSKATALFVNEEILQRICIKIISTSLHLKPLLKTLFPLQKVYLEEKRSPSIIWLWGWGTFPVSPGVEMLLLHCFLTSQAQRMRRNNSLKLIELYWFQMEIWKTLLLVTINNFLSRKRKKPSIL